MQYDRILFYIHSFTSNLRIKSREYFALYFAFLTLTRCHLVLFCGVVSKKVYIVIDVLNEDNDTVSNTEESSRQKKDIYRI